MALFAVALSILGWSTILAYIVRYYYCFTRNLHSARESGLLYIVSPIYPFNTFWLMTHQIWIPLVRKLPHLWTSKWIDFLDPEWTWKLKHKPFASLQNDVFLLVSPGKNVLFVADAHVINQITSRQLDFPKPVELYRPLNLFGGNVLTTECSLWHRHRNIVSPAFNKGLYCLVWSESIHQTHRLLEKWTKVMTNNPGIISQAKHDILKLSLRVISCATLGTRTGTNRVQEEKHINFDVLDVRAVDACIRANKSFQKTLLYLLDHIILLFLMPTWILALSPFASQRYASRSVFEYSNFMRRLYHEKCETITNHPSTRIDIMSTACHNSKKSIGHSTSNISTLKYEEIVGNMFILLIAGHETVASTINCALIYLALNWKAQQQLQCEIDQVFGTKLATEWEYDLDMNKMVNGMLGAVMDEVLRLVPPIVDIPKCTSTGSRQSLFVNGRTAIIPGNTLIKLAIVAAQRNPKFWPSTIARHRRLCDDLERFNPGRWVESTNTDSTQRLTHRISKPYSPGAYTPFSRGSRACMGRRFAQIEILVTLAMIFQKYSIELAVDEFTSDLQIQSMDLEDRKYAWQRAADRASLLMQNMKTVITLQMRGASVPLRLVERGQERFPFTT